MTEINSRLLKKFVQKLGDRLSGDWVIIGGTVLPLVGLDVRVTLDIDLAGKTQDQLSQTFEIMKIAEELGLPVEAINQAAAFFLHKIKDFENELHLVHKGKKSSIYRPNLFLFLQLKIKRFSESDQQDCLLYAKHCNKVDSSEDIRKAVLYLEEQVKHTTNMSHRRILESVLAKLG